MSSQSPWETGDHEARWDGYFIPGTDVLRNRVGATSPGELRDAENDLVEIRVAELRAGLIGAQRTYDLRHLMVLHRHLFQDVHP